MSFYWGSPKEVDYLSALLGLEGIGATVKVPVAEARKQLRAFYAPGWKGEEHVILPWGFVRALVHGHEEAMWLGNRDDDEDDNDLYEGRKWVYVVYGGLPLKTPQLIENLDFCIAANEDEAVDQFLNRFGSLSNRCIMYERLGSTWGVEDTYGFNDFLGKVFSDIKINLIRDYYILFGRGDLLPTAEELYCRIRFASREMFLEFLPGSFAKATAELVEDVDFWSVEYSGKWPTAVAKTNVEAARLLVWKAFKAILVTLET